MMVESWVRELTEDVIGGSPVRIGGVYEHPTDGLIRVESGQYWGTHGVSNHWRWTVLATGEVKAGYANWEAPTTKSGAYVEASPS
jgi:hypothetical protein